MNKKRLAEADRGEECTREELRQKERLNWQRQRQKQKLHHRLEHKRGKLLQERKERTD